MELTLKVNGDEQTNCIGVSFGFNQRQDIEVTGIHLDKEFILNLHLSAASYHECHHLDHFQSNLHYLFIGNLEKHENIKAYRRNDQRSKPQQW